MYLVLYTLIKEFHLKNTASLMELSVNVLVAQFVRCAYEDAFHAPFISPICINLRPLTVAVPN